MGVFLVLLSINPSQMDSLSPTTAQTNLPQKHSLFLTSLVPSVWVLFTLEVRGIMHFRKNGVLEVCKTGSRYDSQGIKYVRVGRELKSFSLGLLPGVWLTSQQSEVCLEQHNRVQGFMAIRKHMSVYDSILILKSTRYQQFYTALCTSNKHIYSPNSPQVGSLIPVFPVLLQMWKTEAQKIKNSHLELYNYLATNSRLDIAYPFPNPGSFVQT